MVNTKFAAAATGGLDSHGGDNAGLCTGELLAGRGHASAAPAPSTAITASASLEVTQASQVSATAAPSWAAPSATCAGPGVERSSTP